MKHNTARKRIIGIGVAAAISAALTATGAGPAAAAKLPTITIDAPGAPVAGPVTLTGNVGISTGATTSVMYVLDATNSTGQLAGMDCSGDGVVNAADDYNGDGSSGDVLDCEIASVISLNSTLTGDVQAGVTAFIDSQAKTAAMDPMGASFAPIKATDENGATRLDTVARSVTRSQIGEYVAQPLTSAGSSGGAAYTPAVTAALDALASAPAGPKYILFLSDGESGVSDAALNRIEGTRDLRMLTFGLGTDACKPYGGLSKMASRTGEHCEPVDRPTSLTATLATAQPDSISSVTVSVQDVSVAASVNAIGGWSAPFVLGAGTYTADARLVLSSGGKASASRVFTVAASPTGPAPGSVSAGAGALKASTLKVDRPRPTRLPFAKVITGRAGALSGATLVRTSALAGAAVTLEARGADKGWATVGTGKVLKNGSFRVAWKPKRALTSLRVVLEAQRGYGASSRDVPAPAISSCKVTGHGSWTVTCHTPAKTGHIATLASGRVIVDKARVRKGAFTLHGRGKVAGSVIDLALTRRQHVKLVL